LLSVFADVGGEEDVAESPYDMSAEQHIASPAVPAKQSSAIIRHMENMGRTFSKHGLDTKPVRRGEVLCVIIPADKLFGPNQTEIMASGMPILRAFEGLVKRPELYKIVVMAHCDDTGDEVYSDNITDVRANAVDDFLENMAGEGTVANVIPYGMGYDEPILKNDSYPNRRANRRVELYIVPTQRLIDMAASGKLN